MKTVGALRVKNEARWIRRSIESILPLCERVVVFDDHSTDTTPNILACMRFQGAAVETIQSPFEGLDEARDKNHLLDHVRPADWVIMIDGDEILLEDGFGFLNLAAAMQNTTKLCLSLPVLYAWDREDQIRKDGVYGNYRRQSVFRPFAARFGHRGGANFHCGNVPAELRVSTGYVEAPLLHFGYLHKADRVRKFDWYNAADPNNLAEDRYRHMVVGDVFPADAVFRHGGPLKLEPIRTP